jgi:hypothetical protein
MLMSDISNYKIKGKRGEIRNENYSRTISKYD